MEALGLDLLHFWLIVTVCLAAGIISNFWHSAAHYRQACHQLTEALERTLQDLAACQFSRDDWCKMADERELEIIKLQKIIDDAI